MSAESKPQTEIWPESPAADSVPSSKTGSVPQPARRFKPIDRAQMALVALDVEQLLPADHPARGIWTLTGQLDWTPFQEKFKAVEGQAGGTPYHPRLLACLWMLAYSESISAADEIEQRCTYHPAYRWLAGLKVVGSKTLANFRVAHKEALNRLFVQVLAALQEEGMISGEQIMQDGTKIRAAASPGSMHREQRLRRHLKAAQQRVEQLSRASDADVELSRRRKAARQRGAQQRLETLKQSLEELQQLQQAAQTAGDDPAQCRVSATEPEARTMKQPIVGGYAPSYNVQLMTDAAHGLIVDVAVVQAGNDQGQLELGLDRLKKQTRIEPKQAVVDGGYASWNTVRAMDQRKVELIAGGTEPEARNVASNQKQLEKRGVAPEFYPQQFVYDAEQDLYRCPAGQRLSHRGVQRGQNEVQRHQYRAPAAICQACPHYAQCCPGSKSGRTISRTQYGAVIQAFVEKMKTPAAQAVYKLRKRVAEFPNLWIKEKLGLRRFSVRGLEKVTCESLWVCLTYNLQRWWRARLQPQPKPVAA